LKLPAPRLNRFYPRLLEPTKLRDTMSAENWHEERDRLVKVLEGIESGEVTHIDESNDRQLEPTNPKNVAGLKERLAQLNARLGNEGI